MRTDDTLTLKGGHSLVRLVAQQSSAHRPKGRDRKWGLDFAAMHDRYGLRRFSDRLLIVLVAAICTASERSRTQFVGNFDQRGRNISLGRAFRKRDPLE